LFDQDDVADLGLSKAPGTETVSIFKPTPNSDHFSNGVVLTAFKGYLYAQWQSSPTDEDSTDTWTAYSRSQDGKTCSAPMVLAAKSTDQRSSGGWWVSGDTLVAYINVYPTGQAPRAYQVNTPVTTNRRSPLVVTLSRDGHYFDKAFALRFGGSELQALRYAGKAKTLGYDYPKSMVHDGYLYVAYSVNKEDVEYTRVPLTSLSY
jgi:hypothetical protein